MVACSVDRRAVFRYETNDTSVNDGKWYFFLDDHWLAAVAETDCSKKMAMSKFTSEYTCCNNCEY